MTINRINTPLTDNATAGKINEIINADASKHLDNLSPFGYALLNDSKALESGAIGCDEEVYEDIYKYAHSSSETGVDRFLNNCSIVGSPVINGSELEVKYCDSSNYVSIDASFITEDSWDLYFPLPTDTWNDYVDLFTITGGTVPALKVMLGADEYDLKTVSWYLSTDGSTTAKEGEITLSPYVSFEESSKALVHVAFSGTEYTLEVILDGTTYSLDSYTSSTKLYGSSSSKLNVCNSASSTAPGFNSGYLNLDKIKIEVSDNTVFSGATDIIILPYTQSKTGSKIVSGIIYHDKIKALYNKEGYAPYYMINESEHNAFEFNVAPSNGVISGFGDAVEEGSRDKVRMSLYPLTVTSSLDVYIKGVYTLTTAKQFIFNCRLGSSTSRSLNLYMNRNGEYLGLDCSVAPNLLHIIDNIADNSVIEAHVRFTSTKLEIWVKVNGGVEVYRSSEVSAWETYQPETFQIGSQYSTNSRTVNQGWKGSIDLASTRLVIDDEDITYAYTSHCYSLPMGEIYGMTQKTATSVVDEKIGEVTSDFATKDLDNLSSSGYAVLNDSKALKTGLSVENDSTVYGQIAQMYTDPNSVSKTAVELANGSIIGNPTISSAKVLDNSTCDNSNYVKFSTADFITEDAWKITVPFPTSSWNSNSGIIYIVGSSFYCALQVKLRYSNNAFTGIEYKFSSNGSSYFSSNFTNFSGYTVPFNRDSSDVSLLSVEFTGTSYIISTNINSTEATVVTITSSNKIYNPAKSGLCIGITMETGFGSYGAGYIDLSQVKVEVGSETVIQGSTDVIPVTYVESIEGLRITDSSYRDSFEKMYSSKGYVPYATIDTTSENYTIPMGELYGMLNKIDDSAVHLSGYEDITGVKTFIGEKRIRFKQDVSSDKLGFTLLNSSANELGTLEYRPSTVNSKPLLSLGNWATSSDTVSYVGFRMHYGNGTSAAGNTYNLVAPLIDSAMTDFSIDSGFIGTNFYLPLGFANGSKLTYTSSTGKVDLTSILPSDEFIQDSHALETGAVHNNPSVYSWVAQMYGGTTFILSSFGTVGSPTISADGMMSYSNKGNYVYIPDASFLTGDDWELKIPNPNIRSANTTYVTTGDPTKSDMTENANPSQSTDPGFHSFFFRLRSSGQIYFKLSSNGTSWDIANAQTASYDKNNTRYFIIRFHKNEGVYKVSVVENGSDTEIEKISISSSSNLYSPQDGLKLYIGGLSTNTSSYIQDVDLTQVEVRVQGQVVFSPVTVIPYVEGTDSYTIYGNLVEIPYHLSTTGSKVTTAEYRSDIQSVYEQQGYAPYFTFDTSDNSYTLPMGEIYGMLNRAARTTNATGNTNNQIYLVGATSQTENALTYSYSTAYVDTFGRVHSAAPASNSNDTTVATTAWVTGKGYATDSAVVHLADTETITGNKTFSGTVDLGASATATTPASTDNSTSVATTAYVKSQNYVAVTIRNWD